MAQTGNFKSPQRLGSLEGGAGSSSGAVTGGKPREGSSLPGVDFERRSFLGKVVGGIGAVVAASTLYPVVKFITPPPVKETAEVDEMVVGKASEVPPDSGKIYPFNKDKVIVVNNGGELTACSAVCTHLGCLVQWKEDEELIYCACHGARYKQTGEIISGPQPLPLAPYKARIEGEDLIIAKA
ncbi:ubiquinol-cytochrome c reductase iron-sulfur subunit [Prosthecochloris sp. HL-130-GSB]|jgi:cytochrome b6-f complex iron-sulfur subunit|uniref:QcrA and Rieske domain-containing protein n=1 Tax=Prosthecochloris sp. HL-130-GSB TaxID=1974213 RepID=UPI000A1C1670|nr:Rieske 2Fe-2S domain-containing protein [Prosthecochloris sp. HL-130-GSB]ARM31397.1 cytochrome B6 [Prosthecochloris sp. HL-130-GSB]MBO8093460.1 Rieske 2Fe-2S domain-containing protein [Prosthecochloris sp.]